MATYTSSPSPRPTKRVRFSNPIAGAAATIGGVQTGGSLAPPRSASIGSIREFPLSEVNKTPPRPQSPMLREKDLAGTAQGTFASVYPSQEQGFAKPGTHIAATEASGLHQQRRETSARPPDPQTPENKVDVQAQWDEACRAPRRRSGQELFTSPRDTVQGLRDVRKLDLGSTVSEQSVPRTPPNPKHRR